MATGFAGGLADGLRNGMAVVNLYERAKALRGEREEAEERRADDQAIKESLRLGLADVAATAGQGQAAGGDAAAPPMRHDEPTLGTDGLDMTLARAGSAAGLGQPDGARPALAMAGGSLAGVLPRSALQPSAAGARQAEAPADAGLATAAPQRGASDDINRLADSLTRGYRKALELGRPGRAMELLAQRERVTGQVRQQAYQDAMAQFELTGDPNSVLPFVNRFMPGGLEIRGVQERPERAGGDQVYMVRAFDPRSGREVEEPFTRRRLLNFMSSIGDPQTYQAMVVQQAKALYDEESAIRKKRAESQIETEGRLAAIRAQGEEARRTDAARERLGGRTGAPAEVQTARWLMENGVAEDAGAAWDMVRGARTKSRQEFVADLAKTLLSNQDPMAMGEDRMTPQAAVQQASALYDSLVENEGRGRARRGDRADASQRDDFSGAPAPGTVEDGWRFIGGDPADQANWERM
jgi:hypothetical protein